MPNARKAEQKKSTAHERDGGRSALRGYAEDGKGIYESNFPVGTPKAAKSKRILEYIQNVWSKKPIDLIISNGEKKRTIKAQFDPTYDPSSGVKTDASKIAAGNRHGTHSEQRVTLDLADDYYRIASEAKYNYSKIETGKTLETHKDVIMWHYFVNDIYFAEQGQTKLVPYTVTINVKEKSNGDYVYSFNAEKESSTRRTLHADVSTVKGANGELFIESIPQTAQKNNPSGEKSSKKSRSAIKTVGKSAETSKAAGKTEALGVALARENRAIREVAEGIVGYKQMSEVNRERVRAAIRTARAEGLTDADVRSIGLFCARSGMRVLVTSKLGANENAHYDGNNTIYVSSKIDSDRTYGQLVAHEMWHKMLNSTGERGVTKALLRSAWKRLPTAERRELTKVYREHYKSLGYTDAEIKSERILEDEVASAYAEKLFTKEENMRELLKERPEVESRVEQFFSHKAAMFKSDSSLSGAARKWLARYKRLFDKVSASAEHGNAVQSVSAALAVGQSGGRSAKKGENGVDEYTETEYNNYGWARANEILTAGESEYLRSEFANAVTKRSHPPKTKSGEYMIEVGDVVHDKIVYMTGTIDDPYITRVLEIYETDETKLDELRRNLYESAGRRIQSPTSGVFRLHDPADYGYIQYKQRGGVQSQRYNDQLGAQRERGGKTAGRIKEIIFGENGEVISEKRVPRKGGRSALSSAKGAVDKLGGDLDFGERRERAANTITEGFTAIGTEASTETPCRAPLRLSRQDRAVVGVRKLTENT